MALNPKQDRFVQEYLIDLNATQAAVRAGYSKATAAQIGAENLTKPEIAEAIEKAQAERSHRTQITADMVLTHWWDVSQADPNELVQYRRGCCRHCWGEGFGYQFTPAEHEIALRKWTAGKEEGSDPTAEHGGLDFDATRDPNPECIECRGEGTGKLHALDTRKLKGSARLLYKGAKRTKDGLEIMLHDQAKALENVAKHLGMFVERREVSGPGGLPVQIISTGMTAKEAADAYAATVNEEG